MKFWLPAACAATVLSGCVRGFTPEERDLVIYGSSPAALTAAIEAQRLGRTAVIVCPETRIGGLTTGGLGQTDIGNKSAFGGLALQFYKDVADWYKIDSHWKYEKRSDYIPDGQCAGSFGEDSMWTFEPSAALAILERWERENKLEIVRGEFLDRKPGGVVRNGSRIVAIKTLSGKTFRGKMFVDATYEGDLMAAAGVSYTIGREANSAYGETISGIALKNPVRAESPLEFTDYLNDTFDVGGRAAILLWRGFELWHWMGAMREKGHIRKGEQEALKGYLEETLNAAVTEAGASHRRIRNLIMHIAVRMTDCFRTIYGSMNAFREPDGFDFARLFALRSYRDMQGWLFQLCGGLFAANRTLLGRSTSIVGMAVDYITEHFREGVTLRQVAADCHVNTSYLGQIFRKETGSAFTDYVNTLRIQEAGRLLADPKLKVYEIAQQVGFTDYHYFLKIFKKVTGRSPTDLRN